MVLMCFPCKAALVTMQVYAVAQQITCAALPVVEAASMGKLGRDLLLPKCQVMEVYSGTAHSLPGLGKYAGKGITLCLCFIISNKSCPSLVHPNVACPRNSLCASHSQTGGFHVHTVNILVFQSTFFNPLDVPSHRKQGSWHIWANGSPHYFSEGCSNEPVWF